MADSKFTFYPAIVEEEKKYRASEALSQSEVKAGLYTAIGEAEPPRSAFTFGSLVDCLAFMPSEFDERFYVGGEESATYGRYADDLLARFTESGMGEDDIFTHDGIVNTYDDRVCAILLDYLDSRGLYASKTAEKRVQELADKAGEILAKRFKVGDRTTVTQEEFSKANLAAMALTTHEKFGWLITGQNPPRFAEGVKVELYHQLPLYFTFDGVACKALPDIVVRYIYDGREVIHLIDLKTTSTSMRRFAGRFEDYGYDLQLEWYTYALIQRFKGAEIQSSILLVNRDLMFPPTMLLNALPADYLYTFNMNMAIANYKLGRDGDKKPYVLRLDGLTDYGFKMCIDGGAINMDGSVVPM